MPVAFHTALLDLRAIHDRLYSYLNTVLNGEVKDVLFKWSGTTFSMHFEATLNPMPKDGSIKEGTILYFSRTVSGAINGSAVRVLIHDDSGEAESMLYSMSDLDSMSSMLWELSLSSLDPSQSLGGSHLFTFNAKSFEARPGAFHNLYENWNNHEEICISALAHYQMRMDAVRTGLRTTPAPLDFLQEKSEGADEQAPWGNN